MNAKLKIGDRCVTNLGPGVVQSLFTQSVRVGGWDGHNQEVLFYNVVLDGDTHPRPVEAENIKPVVSYADEEKTKLAVSFLTRLVSWIENGQVNLVEVVASTPAVPVDENGLGVMVQMVPSPRTTVTVVYEAVSDGDES